MSEMVSYPQGTSLSQSKKTLSNYLSCYFQKSSIGAYSLNAESVIILLRVNSVINVCHCYILLRDCEQSKCVEESDPEVLDLLVLKQFMFSPPGVLDASKLKT